MIRAASTYSLRRSTIVEARTVRAYCTHAVSDIARTSTIAAKASRRETGNMPRNTALTRIAINSVGMLSTVSPMRIRTLSRRPPK